MDLLLNVLNEIAQGKTRFLPKKKGVQALEEFQTVAQALIAAEKRGLLGKVVIHKSALRGRFLIDQAVITEGLTYDGSEFLGKAVNDSPIKQARVATEPTTMRDHSIDEIRKTILDIVFKRVKVVLEPDQYSHLEEGVKEVFSRQEGLHSGNPTIRNFAILSDNDRERIFEVFNALKQEDILIDGINRLNPGPPFFRVTKKGESLVNGQSAMPENKAQNITMIPEGIQKSLAAFRKQHPNQERVGFLIMRFGKSKAHQQITETIRKELRKHGLEALRADDKDYHDDLFPNIQTYLYGCGFGIAVLERIEEESFNPNVALEIGFMMALGKPVLLLKDHTLKNLHTDLVGRLYRSFDVQDIENTVGNETARWLTDKGLAHGP